LEKPIENWLPKRKKIGSDQNAHGAIARYIKRSSSEPRSCVRKGKKTADSIWLWGEGRAPRLDPITARYGDIKGGVISAVDLIMGIGVYAGLEILHVDGATGYTDTNYLGKADRALEYLRDGVFCLSSCGGSG